VVCHGLWRQFVMTPLSNIPLGIEATFLQGQHPFPCRVSSSQCVPTQTWAAIRDPVTYIAPDDFEIERHLHPLAPFE
jgi:cytochrome P450